MAVNDFRMGAGPRWLLPVAVVASLAVAWTLARPASEVEQGRRHFAELQQQVAAATTSKATRAAARARVLRLQAQARAATGAERDNLERQASATAAQFDWSNRSAVRQAVLGTSLIALRSAAPASSAAGTRPPDDGSAVVAAQSSGCVACHLNIISPGFESYPSPLRTHPALEAYLGPSSPHPATRVQCRECHEGNPAAVTFAGAGHSRLAAPESGAADRPHAWTPVAGAGAMLPLTRTEASCVSCHEGEWDLPRAPALNAAYVAYDRGGCFACHAAPGYERGRRRGPDLRRVGAKLSPDWVRQWLRSPKGVKPATWMPEFWQQVDFSGDGQGTAEVDAVVAYLFASAEPYTAASRSLPSGDADRGKRLVSSIGCLGCHITEAGASRPPSGLRRTFGPPLQSLKGKLSAAWLQDWLMDPARYSPTTPMPSLRLTGEESADVAAYLLTLDGPPSATPASSATDETLRAVASAHGQAAADITGRLGPEPASLSGDALRVETGRRVIAALGCYQCHAIAGFEYLQPTQYAFRLGTPVSDRDVLNGLHTPPQSFDAASEARDRATWRRAPRFTLQTDEASALALALTAFPRSRSLSGSVIERAAGRALVHERNCVGCHVIEGTGGDVVKMVSEPSLGPPLLTPEGARVQPDWLRAFLREPRTIRPWLTVRMPSFGLRDDELTQVGGYLRAIAPPNPAPSDAPAEVTPQVGQELFDLLKCQQCHVLGSVPAGQPSANLAPDLRLAHERLQPEWIQAWLRHPDAILPGTRMPSFWPDYPKSFYAPLNKDGVAQVRAIRDHVLTLR